MKIHTKLEQLDNLIQNTLENIPDGYGLILDGIIDPDKYFKSKYKILWILKEANDSEPNEGVIGDWDLRGLIRKGITEYTYWKRTYLPIVYTSWGILNDFATWKDIPDYDDDPSILDVLKQIAIINIKKYPGGSMSNEKEIASTYKIFKDVLLKQIEVTDPNILIFGGTIEHFIDDLSISRDIINTNGSYFDGSKLFIKNYHPNQRRIKREAYCMHNINSAKLLIDRQIK